MHLDRAHELARPGAERMAIDEIRELMAQMHEDWRATERGQCHLEFPRRGRLTRARLIR